jgi:hypothetical protein
MKFVLARIGGGLMVNSRRFSSLLLTLMFCVAIVAPAQSQDRSKLEKKIESLMTKLRNQEKEFLAPAVEDQEAFANFLRQADTGLTRLLPRETYDGKLLTRGGGAYYSFVRLTHEYGFGSDISLEQNQFGVGLAGADFGFLVKLGDVPIETVSLEHAGVQYLAAFAAPSIEAEARDQYRRGHPGFEQAGFLYAGRIPAIVNMTYAVRSIDYRASDILVAFRVIRQDKDGSLTLIWKVLKKFPIPQLNP